MTFVQFRQIRGNANCRLPTFVYAECIYDIRLVQFNYDFLGKTRLILAGDILIVTAINGVTQILKALK